VLRALYPRLLASDEELTQTAFALDSVLTEVLFVAGPLITAALVAFADPGAALWSRAPRWWPEPASSSSRCPDRTRPEPTPALGGGAAGRARGSRDAHPRLLHAAGRLRLRALEVAIPGFADAEGRPELAGILIAIWVLGSAAGGIVYGARPRRAPLARVHLVVALLVPVSFLPIAIAWSPAAMALLVVPAGIFIAPLIATRNELAGHRGAARLRNRGLHVAADGARLRTRRRRRGRGAARRLRRLAQRRARGLRRCRGRRAHLPDPPAHARAPAFGSGSVVMRQFGG
jgi:hypothetical protein